MEFLDEETRPRFLFQSRPSPTISNLSPQTLDFHKPTILISLSLSSLLFSLSFLYTQPEPLNSLVFWFAFSLLVGPFAPSSLTAGDIRVGLGPLLQPPKPQIEETNPIDLNKKSSNRRLKSRKPEELGFNYLNSSPIVVNEQEKSEKCGDSELGFTGEEREWSEGDVELLRKQMVKHPVGMPGRWEAVAEGFRGRHGVESVIKKAKSMGEKKVSDSDSFSRFLKDRKPVDKRVEEAVVVESGGGGGEVSWSGGEDIALLNALKAFPKDAAMRWEKITAAVPGKSKAACMKRVAELKRDFRSSKASAEA